MSTAQFVHFGDVKHCVICGKKVAIEEGAISCCPQFKIDEKECVSLLTCCARDGQMKFCYACGTEMIFEEDSTFCGSCQDTPKFDATHKIQLSDIKYCPLCAKVLRPIQNGVVCEKKCNFRVVVRGTQRAMSVLMEYAKKGKIRYCYSCGSEARSDSLHVVCSKNDCDSCKLPLQHDNGSEDELEKPRKIRRVSHEASTLPQPMSTLASVIASSYQRLNEEAGFELYKVTTFVVFENILQKIKRVEIGSKCLDPSVPSKVLIILGQTGAGKSTLINAIVNYIFDIKWENSFRFVLIPENKSQTQSQTQWITAYTFHLIKGFKITFNLTIIDTPGFGDTQGIEKDKKLVDQIQELFSTPMYYGIDHLDGIALTVKAHDSRLTHTQSYIFNAVMSIFGKDVGTNIFIMATHADGGTPKVFEALQEAGIPTDKTFLFNNSALFTPLRAANEFSKMYWEMGVQSINSFLANVLKVESKSLTLTKEVLKDRKQLEVCIQGLQQHITQGISKISCLRQEKKLLQEYKETMHASKNFTYEVVVDKQRLVNLPPGKYVTNCLTCNCTCHYPCSINTDDGKHGCSAMKPQTDPVNAACTVCPGKCSWQKHKNTPHRYEMYSETEERTYEDLKKRYHIAIEEKGAKEEIIKKITAEKRQIEKEVFRYIQQAHSCIENLDKIALKPNPLSQVQYIQLLIQAEQSDHRPGWENRVQQYERARKAAELMFHIKEKTMDEFLKKAGFNEDEYSDGDENQAHSTLPNKSCSIS